MSAIVRLVSEVKLLWRDLVYGEMHLLDLGMPSIDFAPHTRAKNPADGHP